MQIPQTFDVLDGHGGFTAFEERGENAGGTLWRPGRVLRRGTVGRLIESKPSFWQQHNDATLALYHVKGYRLKVGIWFCNRTGKRLDGTTQCYPTGCQPCGCQD